MKSVAISRLRFRQTITFPLAPCILAAAALLMLLAITASAGCAPDGGSGGAGEVSDGGNSGSPASGSAPDSDGGNSGSPASGSAPGSDGGSATDAVYDFPILLYQGADAVGGADTLHLSDLRGQPVVLNFWAGLCPPCRAEMPEFQHFADDYAGRALVIGVDLGQFFALGSQADAQRLLSELSVTYPAGYTEDAGVVRALELTGLPATIFIAPDGSLHRKWIGVLNGDKLAEITDAMLAQ